MRYKKTISKTVQFNMGILDFGIEEGGLLVVGIGSGVKNVFSMLNNEQGKYHLLYMGE